MRGPGRSSPTHSLRPATLAQAAILADMMGEFYAEDSYGFERKRALSAFRELLNDRKLGQVWLISVEGQPVGYIALAYSFSMEFSGKYGMIEDFYIRKPWRSAGIGRKVLSEVIVYARKKGLKALLLEVSVKKRDVQRFYKSMGFNVRVYHHLASKIIRE